MAFAAANSMRLLILRARAFSAPRKMPGNASALLTLRPSIAKEAPAERASSTVISGFGLDSARITCPLRTISFRMSPAFPVVAMTMPEEAMTSSRDTGVPPTFAKISEATGLMSVPNSFRTP